MLNKTLLKMLVGGGSNKIHMYSKNNRQSSLFGLSYCHSILGQNIEFTHDPGNENLTIV